MITRQLTDVEMVTDGLAFPEGPVALDDGSVLVVEIVGGRLTRVDSDGSKDVIAELGGGPNGAAIGPDGAVYVCNNGGMGAGPRSMPGIQRVDIATGDWSWLYTDSDGAPFVAPNDLVFDAAGGFWFTDLRGGTLHYATASGSSVATVARATDPNGIGLSPGGDILYWAQTSTRQVLRRRIASPGRLAPSVGHGARALTRHGSLDPFTLLVGLPGAMELDSLAVDSSGAVCVGTLVQGGVTEVPAEGSSDDGLDGIVHWVLPDRLADRLVTNICFGGDDLTTAHLACSETGRLVRCRWHRPGLALAFGAANANRDDTNHEPRR